MKKFTLYTETKGNLATLTGALFDSFTVSQSQGYWKGQAEQGTQIVILSEDPKDIQRVHKLAEQIKETNQQDAVLVTAEDVAGYLA